MYIVTEVSHDAIGTIEALEAHVAELEGELTASSRQLQAVHDTCLLA